MGSRRHLALKNISFLILSACSTPVTIPNAARAIAVAEAKCAWTKGHNFTATWEHDFWMVRGDIDEFEEAKIEIRPDGTSPYGCTKDTLPGIEVTP